MPDNYKLLVIRHGETVWGNAEIIQGQMDSPLTPNGVKQVENICSKLKGVDVIVSSDLGRALMTAKIIADKIGIKNIYVSTDFRERYLGSLQGKPKSDAKALFSDGYDLNDLVTLMGLEPEESFFKRIKFGMDWIGRRNERKVVVLVTHGGVIRRLYCVLKEKKLSEIYDDMQIGNCTIHEF